MKNQLLSTLKKKFQVLLAVCRENYTKLKNFNMYVYFFSAMDPWRFSVIKEGRAIKLHTNWRAPAHSVSFGEFLFYFLLKSRTKIHQILTLCSLPSCQADVSWAKVQCRQVYLVVAASAHWYSGVWIIQKILQCGAKVRFMSSSSSSSSFPFWNAFIVRISALKVFIASLGLPWSFLGFL